MSIWKEPTSGRKEDASGQNEAASGQREATSGQREACFCGEALSPFYAPSAFALRVYMNICTVHNPASMLPEA